MSAGIGTRTISVEDLRPEAGEPVETWIENKFLPFLRQREIISIDPGADVAINPSGTRVHYYQAGDPFRGRFRVQVSDREIRVGAGMVNEIYIPTIGGIDLEGRDAETEQLVDAPSLPIEPPESDGQSFVCVSLLTDGSGIPLIEEKDWLTIEHVTDLRAERRRRPETGFQPLARLWWEGGSIQRFRQMVFHDLKHFHVPAAGDRPGFHHFDGV